MTMTLDEFRTTVRVLPAPDAEDVRRRFETAFLRAGIEVAHMWGGLRDRQRVSLARLWATVAAAEVVHVMWDPPGDDRIGHLCDRVFGPFAVLECRVVDLERGVDWLPDDLYLFDESYTWSAIFTHESDVDGGVQLLARADASIEDASIEV